MTEQTQHKAPAGTWESTITPDVVVAGSRRLADPRVIGDELVWLEGRPEQKGRVVLVRERADGKRIDLVPSPMSVRSHAHEYGGGVYAIDGARVFFVNAADQRIYVTDYSGDSAPQPLTVAAKYCYGDLIVDARRQRLIAACEDHSGDGEAVTTLVAVDLTDGAFTTLAAGADFYSSPALDASGDRLAYLEWNHPNMPWDATRLMLATFDADGLLDQPRSIGHADTAHFQPRFGPDGSLYVVADNEQWWNLQRLGADGLEPLATCAREFAFPQWTFGMSTYGFLDAQTIVAASTADGVWALHTVDTRSGAMRAVPGFDYTAVDQLGAGDGRVTVIAGGVSSPLCIASARVNADQTAWHVHQRSSELQVDPATLSIPQTLTIREGHDDACHGFYYPPANADFALEDGERPPLLVKCHGGPTGATVAVLDPKIQYWTSRGFAVLDLNYRGSTGYGRDYRRALWGQWGITDVQDCKNAARELAERGLADPERCVISGGSAGGYTVLCALTFDNSFAAGASHYGIGDLELLASDTHKFESRYLDRCVGPYPERKDLYVARSPIAHVEQLRCPVIFFQGLDDKVVPPNQAETMVAALKNNGIPVGYVTFEGEGHGFRNSDNIKYALAAELAFYGHVLGFIPAGDELDLAQLLVG
ncbi:MAG: prolyl oligopeptidase family serine peptidase [Gammaproteobacteria bacterium]